MRLRLEIVAVDDGVEDGWHILRLTIEAEPPQAEPWYPVELARTVAAAALGGDVGGDEKDPEAATPESHVTELRREATG